MKAKTDPRQQATNNHLSNMPSRCLQYSSDDHEEHSKPNSTSSAPFLTVKDAGDGAYKSTKLEGSDDNTLDRGILGLGEH